jgi:hypothetical protein
VVGSGNELSAFAQTDTQSASAAEDRNRLVAMERTVNWTAIAAVGEILGALAVLITLVYLSRQVGHARRDQQIAAIRANRDERRQFFESLRDSPYIHPIFCKIRTGEPLEPAEEGRLRTHLALSWSILFAEWVQSQLDLDGEYSPSFDYSLELSLRNVPGIMEWFHETGTRLYPAAFCSYVESVQRRIEKS